MNAQIPPPQGSANNMSNSARPEKKIVAQAFEPASPAGQIYERLRLNLADGLPEFCQLEKIAHADGITDRLIAQASVFQNGHRGRGLSRDWLIRQKGDFAARINFPNQVKTRQSDDRVPETPKAVNQDVTGG